MHKKVVKEFRAIHFPPIKAMVKDTIFVIVTSCVFALLFSSVNVAVNVVVSLIA